MDQFDPQLVESLFQDALDLEPEARREYLDRNCAEHGELRTEVEKLIRAFERADRRASWNAGALYNEAGRALVTRLDRYEIQERIGTGGMGSVYKAVRKEGNFTKVVAVKIVHSDEPSLLQRFHQERQILAGLQHPNIARLLDVGTTEEGAPYLAMDYVEGEPLDRYVQSRELDQRAILELFRKICGAVAYAHRNLIVHRDLKPANILVTAEGEPKLLDFGIAKLMDATAERTRTGLATMTPEYASPEQMFGGVITTASDVYTLGVLLYELLSGARPYRNTTSPVDLAEAITTVPAERLKNVDEDLDTIVQVSLRKEPERRYASVDQMSEDIRRYLEGYPISARPDTRRYRFSRFARRNRIVVAAGVLLAVAISGGMYSSIHQARIANRHFNEVRKLANSYLFEVYDGLRDLQGATALRELVVKRALEYLDNLSQEKSNDAGLNRELGSAYLRVGILQGAPGLPNLGDPRGALRSFRKSLAIRERLVAADPGQRELGFELAESQRALGELLIFQKQVQEASDLLHRAAAISEKQVAAEPANLKYLDALAIADTLLAGLSGNNEYANLGDPKGAERLYEKARDVRETIARRDAKDLMNRLRLSAVLGKMAAVYRAQARNDEAVKAFVRAISIDEQLMRDAPLNTLYRREAAVDNRSLSLVYLALKNYSEARRAGDRSAAIFEELAKADRTNFQAQEEVADSYWSQGFVLEGEQNNLGAFERYGAAMAQYKKLMELRPGYRPQGLRTAYQLTAGLAAKLGDTAGAVQAAEKQLQIDDEILKASPSDVNPKLNRGVAFFQIGQSHQMRARKTQASAEWRDALTWSRRSMEVWETLQKAGLLNAGYAGYIGRTQAVIDEATEHAAKR